MQIELTKLYRQQSKRLLKKYPSLAVEIPIALALILNDFNSHYD